MTRARAHRRAAESLDCHDLGHEAGEDAGVLEGDGAASEWADDGERITIQLPGEHGDIEHELRKAVLAADGPGAVAVAAQVDGVDAVVLLELDCHLVQVRACRGCRG